ncbi:hypothetical protein [Demequina sp. NBRC 110054]|uniref:hypothetical protein n=1 Tax=Demequina sp. NBRC 110054 TaxID=1570343 RepID=UPI000A01BA79|nr:hypothetical protein [Demequina sp. NBRC 110054]
MSDAPRPEDVTAEDADQVAASGDAPDAVDQTGTTAPVDETAQPDAVEPAAEPAAETAAVGDQPSAEEQPEPTPEELADAVPAVVRHAPRFSRILLTGAGTPAAIGFLLGSLLPNAVVTGRLIAGLLVGLGFGVIGGVITGVYVVTADQRASKRADAEKAELLAQQAPAEPAEGETFTQVTPSDASSDTTQASEADTTDQEETR